MLKTHRKSIGENGKPPCVKCYNEGHSCVLAGSRRGGDYTAYRGTRATISKEGLRRRAAEPNWLAGQGTSRSDPTVTSTAGSGGSSSSGIQNPLEALELLAKVASKENENIAEDNGAGTSPQFNEDGAAAQPIANEPPATAHKPTTGLEFLDPRALGPLLERYHDTYHAFLPLVPRHVLSTRNIDRTATEEPFVLTAVLLIATKDHPEYATLHDRLWESMQRMLLQIVLGSMEVRSIGCVEGLLILAEWVPHANTSHMNVSEKGTGGLAGTEDTAAWTLVGLAVRQAYLLHLDKYAFRGESNDECNPVLHRKRLAWTYTYVADRQISIRMGQAFWCRGPSLATKFTAADFPTLQPHNAYEDDHACVLQAQLELTVLFGNIHDLLYASKPRSISIMLIGDYTKYLDDSALGLAAWKQAWAHLDVGQHLKLILDLQHEYLRLYIHGFAFQAAIHRASGTPPNSGVERPTSRFPHGVLAIPDGRHIHLAISAAKSVLRMLGEGINPTKHLRFLGPRYFLYAIHCAVFLYKASTYGALNLEEHKQCVEIIQQYIENLEAASSCEQHIAARHASLLASLWLGKSRTSNDASNTATADESGELQTQAQVTSAVIGTPQLVQDQAQDSFMMDAGWMTQGAHGSKHPSLLPESLVTGLYGSQFDMTDPFNVIDFGAYGEPDLRSLIAM